MICLYNLITVKIVPLIIIIIISNAAISLIFPGSKSNGRWMNIQYPSSIFRSPFLVD